MSVYGLPETEGEAWLVVREATQAKIGEKIPDGFPERTLVALSILVIELNKRMRRRSQ